MNGLSIHAEAMFALMEKFPKQKIVLLGNEGA